MLKRALASSVSGFGINIDSADTSESTNTEVEMRRRGNKYNASEECESKTQGTKPMLTGNEIVHVHYR